MTLKKIRTQLGLKQEDVAAHLCITRAAYANIENGKRQMDYDKLLKLADLMNVSVDAILGREDSAMQTKKPTVMDDGPEEAIVNLLEDLSPSEVQRVVDFVAGIKAARTKDASRQE